MKQCVVYIPAILLGLVAAEHQLPAVSQENPAVPDAIQLDVPPRPHQKPYSPADGQTVLITPPPFIWVPVKGITAYDLQISKSADFDDADVHTYEAISTSVFVPDKCLPAGRWYWRYGVKSDAGQVFSKPRLFTIPKHAKPFPFPDFDEVISRVPQDHPRVLLPRDHLERLRPALDHELNPLIDALAERCRKYIGEDLVSEPPKPTSGPERVTVMVTTRPPMDGMEQCALVWLLTGDKAFGLEAKRRLLHFFSWDPKGSTCLWSYDEPAMWVMMRGTRAYDWTYELFTPEERSRIEPVMKERARQFYVHLKEKRRFETDPYESHAGRMPGFLGEVSLCFAHEWPEAKEWLRYATLLYYTSYPAWGGDDGGWQEGVPYWSAYMRFALHYVAALRNATGIDLMAKPFFQNTAYHAFYMASPYQQHQYFGDGSNGSPKAVGTLMYAFSSMLRDPYLRWYAQQCQARIGQDPLTLATYDPTIAPQHPSSLPGGRVFPSTGLAAIHTALGDRENDITFLLRSSPFGSVSHGHADQNSFAIEAFGRGLAITTGYYPWYGSPHHHNWTRATQSVNSILVNGEGQVRRSWQARGKVAVFKIGEGYDYVEAEAGNAYGKLLNRFRRHVVHVQPGTFVILDDLCAGEPATFQWLLHTHEKVQIDRQESVLLTARQKEAAMKVHLLIPQDVSISQTNRYTPEPEKLKDKSSRFEDTWHLTASTESAKRTGLFLSVFQVYRPGTESHLARVRLLPGHDIAGVELVNADGASDRVIFRTKPGDNDATDDPNSIFKDQDYVFAEGRDVNGVVFRNLRINRNDALSNNP